MKTLSRFLLPLVFIFSLSSLSAQPAGSGLWLAPAAKPKLYGLKDAAGNVTLQPQYTAIAPGDENSWIVQSGLKYGVINAKGEWLIRPQFESIVQYEHGKAIAGKRQRIKNREEMRYTYSESENDTMNYYGVIDASGTWIVNADYVYLRLCPDGSIQYRDLKGKYGFMNPDGTLLLRPQYDYASCMVNGVAVIGEETSGNYEYYEKQEFTAGNYFVIDRKGNKLNAGPYEMIREFSDGRAAFNKGGIWKAERFGDHKKLVGGKWGFLDENGNESIAPQYDFVYDFENGKAKVRSGELSFYIDKDGKECAAPETKSKTAYSTYCEPGFFGYIDTKGNWVIQPQFYAAENFSEGLAAVIALRASDLDCDDALSSEDESEDNYNYAHRRLRLLGMQSSYGEIQTQEQLIRDSIRMADQYRRRLYGYVNAGGNTVIAAKYEVALPFHDGRAYVRFRDKWGIIDKKGNWIVKPVLETLPGDKLNELPGETYFEGEDGDDTQTNIRDASMMNYSVYNFSEGMGVIYKFGHYGFVDTTGKIIVSPVYDDVLAFSQGLAAVKYKDKWGFIDKSGKEIISLSYNSAASFSKDGYAAVSTLPQSSNGGTDDESLAYESDYNEYFGYIDKTGKWLIKPQFTSAGDFSEGLAAVSVNYASLGYIDKTGKFVIAPKYDAAEPFSGGLAKVKARLYTPAYIDKNGKLSKVFTNEHPPFDKSKPLMQKTGNTGLIGFVNEKGLEIIPAAFQSAGEFAFVSTN